MTLASLIAVARGQEPADLVLARARIVNTFTGEVETGSVAISQGRIAGVGDYRKARETIDLRGKFLAPALIDGHFHLESTLLHPAEYARAVVPRGTAAAVTDLHEIANVVGAQGLRYVAACARRLPLHLFLMAPSCVPATGQESAGASLSAAEVRAALRWRGVPGLGEVMDYRSVLAGSEEILHKIAAARGRPVDGHAPGLRGRALNAYLAAGIHSDHETTTREEGQEKLRRGMHLMLREGSTEKNLEALLPLVTEDTWPRCLLVTDDRTCLDIQRDGGVDAVVRKAIRLGLGPVRALQMATLNPARYFRLEGLGGIAPGYSAHLMVLENLETMQPDMVFHDGELVAEGGRALFAPGIVEDPAVLDTMHVRPFGPEALALSPLPGPIIQIVPGQIVTRRLDLPDRGRYIGPDLQQDILKLAVVERHRATGRIGLGMVQGFGLKRGALASSIAHDSHNIVAVGATDGDLYLATSEVERLKGGLVAVSEGQVLAALALPVAGLFSLEPWELVTAQLARLEEVARGLGCGLPSPFAALSFLTLPTVPEVRLTDRGLVEVRPV